MNIVVIGLGSMGKRRIRLLKDMYSTYQIVGIDTQVDRMAAVSKEYMIKCYASIDAIPTTVKVECAFICTSPLTHATIITDCLQRGFHVFTEINLVTTGYEKNIALAKEKKLTLFLSSTPIYRAEMKKITQLVQSSEKPVNYIYHVGQYLPDWHPWESFETFFVNDKRTNGCRELFAIELPWMSKAFGFVKEVQSTASKMTKLKIDYDDNYMVQITHENGTKGVFVIDVVCRHAVRHLEVYNEELYLNWNGTPNTLMKKNLGTKELELVNVDDMYSNQVGYSAFVNEYAYVNEIKEFFNVLEHGKTMQYGFEEDAKILSVIDEIEGMNR